MSIERDTGRKDAYEILSGGGDVAIDITLVAGTSDHANSILSMAGLSRLDFTAVSSEKEATLFSTEHDIDNFRRNIPLLPRYIKGITHPRMTELLLGILDKTCSVEATTTAAGKLVQAHLDGMADKVYWKLHDQFYPPKPELSTEEELASLTAQLAVAPGSFTSRLLKEKLDRLQNPDKYTVSKG